MFSPLLRKPAAVLFDMDGTLVDSEGIWFEAEKAEFASLGIEWTLDQQSLMIGMSIVEGTRRVLDAHGVDGDPAVIGPRISARMFEMVKAGGVQWRPGACELLERLEEWGVPLALVTSSFRYYAQVIADKAPGKGFDVLVTSDVVTHTKPHPEPFLAAMQALNAEPSTCVAFEDSAAGVISAHDAGAITVAVPFQAPIPDIEGVHILDSLEHADEDFFDRILS